MSNEREAQNLVAPAAEAPQPPPQEDEEVSFELGDRVYIQGGRLHDTRGRIYYMDEDLIRILPDGVSDSLKDIPIVDTEDGRDIDPKLGMEAMYPLVKRANPAFVAQIDAHVGQLADTFGPNGELGITYTITAINEADDAITLQDETGGVKEIVFDFRGIPRDEPFAVLRPRDPPDPVTEENAAEAAAAAAAKAEEDADAFEFIEEVEAVVEESGLRERSATEMFYPDTVQRNSFFQEFLEALNIKAQKDPKQQRAIRKLAELCLLMRNEVISYTTDGDPGARIPTSVQTIGELLEKVEVPLARPVLNVKKSLYLDHSADDLMLNYGVPSDAELQRDPVELPGRDVELNYLEDILNGADEFASSQLGVTTEGAIREGALPAWFASWERYIQQFFRTWTMGEAAGARSVFREDKEFLRKGFSDGIDADTDGLQAHGTAEKAPLVPPTGVTKLKFSVQKGLGPRFTRLRRDDPPKRIESGDEAMILSHVLFPLSTERELGTTRSGRLSKDMMNSHAPTRTMAAILKGLNGVPDIPQSGGILTVGPGGNTSGNIALEDWLKAQPIPFKGLGDALVELKSLGITQKELTQDQQAVLLEKLEQFRALLKQFITEERQLSVKRLSELRLENITLLQGEALEQFIATLAEEPLLAAHAAELRKRLPAYKDNDVALTAGMMSAMSDLFLTALAGVPGPLARERTRRVRDQFLEALRTALAKAQKKASAGEVPTPNKCPHVGDLEMVRRADDDTVRIQLLARLVARFKKSRKDNWLECAVCNKHLMCYHEFLQIQEVLHPREKDTLHKELLLAFSGGVFQGKFICKQCGQPISDLDLDTSLEFDDNGKPMMGRSVIDDRDEWAQDALEQILGGPAEAPEEIEFKTETQTLVYRTARQIADRVGIYPDTTDYQRIVERVETEIQKQPSREAYAKRMAERKARGERMVDYDILINRILVAATAAHLLIQIQTKIPDFVVRAKLPGCRAGFGGFPLGPEADKTGIEYISCAVAGIRKNEAPWNLTGFLRESSDKKRQDLIAGTVLNMIKEATKTAVVQQRLTDKRAELERIYGTAVYAEKIPEAVPGGFRPVPYIITAKQAAETIVVPAAAGLTDLARAWIQVGHQLARRNGTYIRGSPYAEASCCFGPVGTPAAFWEEQAASLPALPPPTPPQGQQDSQVSLPFEPRKQQRLVADVPEDTFYTVFLRVCYDGPRKGLPHEPGYTNTCFHCGFVFPESPYTIMPNPPLSSDGGQAKAMMKEWQSEMDSIVTKGKSALESQKVVVNKATFDDVLDATHLAFKVELPERRVPPAGMPLLVRLAELEPEPFEGWRALMAVTIERVSKLPPGAEEIEVAEAYGPLSNAVVMNLEEMQRRVGAKATDTLRSLLSQNPGQLAESLTGYFLVPFQRLLTGYKPKEYLKVQKSYQLSRETLEDVYKGLHEHTDFLAALAKRMQGFTRAKVEQARRSLAAVIPYLKTGMRASFIPGGNFGLGYIQSALVAGIFAEFINGNILPRVEGAAAAASAVDAGARAPLQILDTCLQRLQAEGLNFTEEQIRDRVAKRAEAEKLMFINKLDKMTPEEKAVELMKKRLGLGDWAVGGTKAIYAYDPEQYERERAQRTQMEAMGLIDFAMGGAATEADLVAAGEAADAFQQDEFYGGGGAGAEGGYEVDQMGEDDY